MDRQGGGEGSWRESTCFNCTKRIMHNVWCIKDHKRVADLGFHILIKEKSHNPIDSCTIDPSTWLTWRNFMS